MSKHPDPPVIFPSDEPRVTYRVGYSHVAIQFIPILAIGIVLFGLFLLPLIKEGVGNERGAVEANALRVASQNIKNGRNQFTNALVAGFEEFLQQKSNGALATYIVKINYPNIPTTIGCAVSYYQLLFNRGDWERFIASVAHSSDAEKRSNPDLVAHSLRAKKIKQRASDDANLNDNKLIAPPSVSANDLAFGLDKLHWGMFIKDARTLFPTLSEEPIQPLQVLATLSLENYVLAKCTFAVHLDFENARLTRVELESDPGVTFGSCHSQILATLVKQYGTEQGGISPVSPYHGYSLHGEWRGPITDVVYNELQNTVIEIDFSPTDAPP